MGFGGFVKVAFKCFDFLAWPLFALGYPLCASIQAIETNSNGHTRKLVTYWVLFSLISHFEHAFVKLLEWVPFWSYIKLVIIYWLVIPHFDGAFFIYKLLVRPCLSIDLQILINWFNKQIDFVLKRDDFLAKAERYVKENGPEALEELIANKSSFQSKSKKPYLAVEESRAAAEEGEGSKCQEPSVMQKDIKRVEEAEKKEETAAKQVNQPEPILAHIENRTFAPVEIKETTAAVEAGWEHTKIPAFKKVQKEWTCAICQVITQSETTLNSHLQGRRHQAACEKLKAKKQAWKRKIGPASASKKSDLPKEENCVSSHKITGKEAKRSDLPEEASEKCASSSGLKRGVIAIHDVKKSDVLKEEEEKCVPKNGSDYKCMSKSVHLAAWSPPAEAWFKLNSYGSCLGNPGQATAGGIIRDQWGNWLTCFSRSLGVTHSLAAELWGLRDGLSLALDFNLKNLEVELDAAVAVEFIRNCFDPHHPLSSLLYDCMWLLNKLDRYTITHIPREANYCANVLAKEGLQPGCFF